LASQIQELDHETALQDKDYSAPPFLLFRLAGGAPPAQGPWTMNTTEE